MSIFYQLEVKEVRRETPDAVSVAFEVPTDLAGDFAFKAGQYITIQKELDGQSMRRAYSVCSSPESGELRVAIKQVDKGRFSTYANQRLKQGDTLDVAGPEGRFCIEANSANNNHYLAVAAGSGITPVISMIKEVMEGEPNSSFTLIYGSKSSDKTIFKSELDALVSKYGSRLEVHYVFSQIISDQALFGRIDELKIKDILKKHYNDLSFHSVFLCGPEAMINEVSATLLKIGYNEDQLHHELFSTTSHKKEINKSLDGNAEICIVLDDEEVCFEMRQDELILDAALGKGLDPPYSCQGGVCSSCLARVTKGEVSMERNHILDEDEVAEGLILTCQAHPTSSRIKIDFDDV